MNREEAINVVKCNWPEGRHQLSEALKALIPEFQESEDERISKWLIDYFKSVGKFWIHRDISPEQVLAYLERQKEYIEDIRQYAYNKGLVDAEEKQKLVNMDEGVELGLDRALQIIKDAKGNLRGYQSDDGIHECEHAIQTLERILKNGIEQKPTEWSEEDEKMRTNAILSLRYLIEEFPNADFIDSVKRERDWLKSLRPQPHWKPSDEDEERLINTSISFLKDFADKGYENAVECIDWLKSKLNGNSGK